MNKIGVTLVWLLCACKSTPAPKAPAASNTDSAAATGACQPVRALEDGETKNTSMDFNGDGTNDLAIGGDPEQGGCGTLECPYDLYVARGECFDPIGQVDHVPSLLTTKHNGYFDVAITQQMDGERSSVTYRFDGKQYIAAE